MFDELTEKFEKIFKDIRGQGRLTESNIREMMRDIRRTLLEADVNYRVGKRFISDIEQKAIGQEVLTSITPGQLLVKIVHDELTTLLGGESVDLELRSGTEVILVCGLQGSGKTTTSAKLSAYLRKKGRNPLLASVDIHRPAAIDQLKILADSNKIPFYSTTEKTPVKIAKGALESMGDYGADILVLDTAGRLHIDDGMMDELKSVSTVFKTRHTIFVADGMTGQDAVNAVEGFMKYVDFDGVILTKMDGDARGGAALSIKEVTGKPILFVGTGERVDAFEKFYPDRFASRILGMGDIVTLVEKAQETVDSEKAEKLQKKMITKGFDLEDFLDQLHQIQKLGPLDQVLGMMPGMGKMMKGMQFSGDEFKHIEAIILSMTPKERREPAILNGSRRKRIAIGSGTTVTEVNNLLKQFEAMNKMMKNFSKIKGMKNLRGFNLPF